MKKKNYRVEITRPFCGLVGMQVCAVLDATDDEILKVCNTDNPSGTSNGWTRVIRAGDGKPVPCDNNESRMHFIVTC